MHDVENVRKFIPWKLTFLIKGCYELALVKIKTYIKLFLLTFVCTKLPFYMEHPYRHWGKQPVCRTPTVMHTLHNNG
jgi:hypothetical protein